MSRTVPADLACAPALLSLANYNILNFTPFILCRGEFTPTDCMGEDYSVTVTTEQIRAAVDAAEVRASARTLYGVNDYASKLAAGLEVARAAGLGAHGVRLRADGGAVPGAYKYRAEATHASVTPHGVKVWRGDARKVSRGDYGRCEVVMAHNDDPALKSRAKKAGLTLRAGYIILD